MTNTLPPGERLLLTIDREVEVECKHHPAQNMAHPGCPKCGQYWSGFTHKLDGTGRITKRIRGSVEVEHPGHPSIFWVKQPDGLSNLFVGERDYIRDRIVTALLDGTLPDEIAKNIEITDIEEAT